MDPAEAYLKELREIRATGAGVPETSYYSALSNLLDEVGKKLKPRVRCVLTLANRGAGMPDGGLFTQEQFQRKDGDPLPGQMPARGVIEVKPTSEDAWVTARGKQVSKYWGRYRQVLVTNYRDFVLIGQDADGKPARLETLRLAGSEAEFWGTAPRTLAKRVGERLTEYLKRVMLHAAPLAEPRDLAYFLASYAKEAKARVEGSDLPALAAVRSALEEALGLKFEGEKGDKFFRSTFIQTLFYGVFSAWVLWAKGHPPGGHARFNWREAAWSLKVPMIRALFEQLATPTKLKPLDLEEVLDWTGTALNRVDRASFFASFEEGEAVQYFYQPFLAAFDPQLQKELGVWYTPPEIVRYMVERVDAVLREELEIEDGLADPRVYVLDPCCGTGSYLVEVLRRIEKTLSERGADALLGEDLKRAAMERVFGFEIFPAPFVVSHLQLGLLLQNLGAPLSESGGERAGVYLTNALTGWEPPSEEVKKRLQQLALAFHELKEESDAAAEVKRERPILVVIGNPPYNAFAGVSPEEEGGLVEPYKEGLNKPESKGGWGIKKFNLDDLYVRFFRVAERRIAEMSGRGVVSFISNHSWVSDPSFVVLRHRLFDSFDRFWIENLHGNRKISEYAPDGRTSETIFAIPGFSVGIQQGVVTSLWVKSGKRPNGARVLFRDDINAAKAVERRAQLLESLKVKNFDKQYETVSLDKSNRFSFRPSKVKGKYLSWPRLTELAKVRPYNGPIERRGQALISVEKEPLEHRMEKYFDDSISDDDISKIYPSLMMTGNRIVGPEARKKIRSGFSFDREKIVKYPFKPFDVRWCYLENLRPLFSEPSPDLLKVREIGGNRYFICRDVADNIPEGPSFYFSPIVCDYHFIGGEARHLPLFYFPKAKSRRASELQGELPGTNAKHPEKPNLSSAARSYLKKLGLPDPDANEKTVRVIWMHALAIGYSPAYLKENEDGIRGDWPRVPLPDSKKALLASVDLGRKVAALLDTESPLSGVTAGKLRPEMRVIAVVSKAGGGSLGAGDLDLTAGWGHAGKGGVTMPGKGRLVERPYEPGEREAIEKGAEALGLAPEDASKRLGETTLDVYLNEAAYRKNVPTNVWDYYIGGYRVIKKWLSYREKKLLGRGLTLDEARYVMVMARRIAALVLLGPALDANYEAVKSACYEWAGGA